MERLIQTLVLLLFIPFNAFATAQVGNILIFKGDTLSLFSNPLEKYLVNKLERTLSGEKLGWEGTACYRGYVATWEVKNDSLFLIKVEKGYFDNTPKYFDLSVEFGTEMVFGAWFTGEIVAPKGKQLSYVHSGYDSFYEKELVLTFKDGLLTQQIEFDNSKSYKSVFYENQDSLQKFINTTIDWAKIPDLKDESIKVILSFQSGETSRPDSVQIIRGSELEIINAEATRVIELIPEWDVYYRYGKVYRMKSAITILFSEENRRRFAR